MFSEANKIFNTEEKEDFAKFLQRRETLRDDHEHKEEGDHDTDAPDNLRASVNERSSVK